MSEERKLILQMLQENRITVDEADKLISALSAKSEPKAEARSASDGPSMSDVFNKTGPKMDQFMGSISSMIDSISQQVGPNKERLEKWFQQRTGSTSTGTETTNFEDKLTREDQIEVESGVASVRCRYNLGDIYIEGYDGDKIQYRMDKFLQHSEDRSRYDEIALMGHSEGEVLNLELKGAGGLDSNNASRVDLYLKLPKSLDIDFVNSKYDVTVSQITRSNGKVKLESHSGDLNIRNLALREIELKTGSGNIQADQASELIKAQSQSGDIFLKGSVYEGDLRTQSGHVAFEASVQHHLKADSKSADLSIQLLEGKGSLDLSTQSGDIELTGSLHSNCTLNTASGDLQCDMTVHASSAVSLTTHSGDVDLILRPGSQAKLEVEAQTGDIECRVDLEHKESDEHNLRGVIGNGEGSLRAKTKSGDILIS